MTIKSPDILQEQINSIISLFSSGQTQEALDSVRALIKDYPNEALLYNMSGGCNASLGQLDMAVKDYKKALAIKPDYAVPQHMLNALTGNKSTRTTKRIC